VHWDQKRGVGLFLAYRDLVSPHMLPSHVHHVAAPLRRVEHELEREPGARADRMRRLKLRDNGRAPSVETVALAPLTFHAAELLSIMPASTA
jgi:hypothetical protein